MVMLFARWARQSKHPLSSHLSLCGLSALCAEEHRYIHTQNVGGDDALRRGVRWGANSANIFRTSPIITATSWTRRFFFVQHTCSFGGEGVFVIEVKNTDAHLFCCCCCYCYGSILLPDWIGVVFDKVAPLVCASNFLFANTVMYIENTYSYSSCQ